MTKKIGFRLNIAGKPYNEKIKLLFIVNEILIQRNFMSLSDQELTLLKSSLESRFVPHLPPLIDQRKSASEQITKNCSRALSAFVIKHIADLSDKDACKHVTDDFDDKGIDAIYYQASSQTLYLIQSKLKLNEEFSLEEANAFCQGVRKIISQNFDDFNSHIQNRSSEIEQDVDECSHIQLVIAYTGKQISVSAMQAIREMLIDTSHAEERFVENIMEYDGDKLLSVLRQSNSYPRVDATLWLECHRAVESGYTSYFGLVPLKNLVELHNKHGKALYVKNIRTFLGRKTDVNSAIQKTLREQPDHFWYLNNGITALCENIEPKSQRVRDGKKQIKIQGLSIINGAQTIASSATAANEAVDIRDAKVLITLIKSPSESDFGKSVTKARNHQNPVSLFNFSALDEEQERLRRDIANLNIDYLYKDGVSDQSGNSISINEAVYALSCLQQDPRFVVWLKKEPATILDPETENYRSIFPETLTAYRLINAVIVYRKIQNSLNPIIRSTNGAERLCYKHGNLALAYVLMKRLSYEIDMPSVINTEALENKLSYPLDQARNSLWAMVTPIVPPSNAAGPGPLALFKNQTYTIRVMKSTMIDNFSLLSDLVIPIKERMQTATQPYPIDLFNYLSAKAPQIRFDQ